MGNAKKWGMVALSFLAYFVLMFLITIAIKAAHAQDAIEATVYIDGEVIPLSWPHCTIQRAALAAPAPVGPSQYAIALGLPWQASPGQLYVNPGAVTVVLAPIVCNYRIFRNGFN